MARPNAAQFALALALITTSSWTGAAAREWPWPRLLLEWPDAPFWPAWTSLPWGPSPDWGLVHRTIECNNDLRMQMAAVMRPCAQEPHLAACKLRVKILGVHAHEYTKNEGGRFDFAKATTELKEKYCRKWGFCESSILTEPTFDNKYAVEERAAPWHKVLAVMQEVAKGDFDWYMWMDGDAAFVDHSIDLRFMIARHTMAEYGGKPNATFLVSKDIWHTPGNGNSNTGVWLIKNGTESLQYLMEWWDVPNHHENLKNSKQHHPWEQVCYNEVMYDKYIDNIVRLPECWLFGHPLSLIDRPFIGHLCGVANHYKQKERLHYFTFWNERIHA